MTFRWTAVAPLLPGEVTDSHHRDEVEHWVAVYEELTRFLYQSSAPDHLLERYLRRLRFWRGRLDGNGMPPPANGQWREAGE